MNDSDYVNWCQICMKKCIREVEVGQEPEP